MPSRRDPSGYLLLKGFRKYLELNMYTSLDNHTETTIAAGKEVSQQLPRLLQVSYTAYTTL